jgi:hypothetical protein
MTSTIQSGRFRFEHGDVVQVAENNIHSLGDGNAVGLTWYKTHRVYRTLL